MTLSTHVLDSLSGRPAAGVGVQLERQAGTSWAPVGEGQTGPDGRLALPAGPAGIYRITFATGEYFAEVGATTFYPEVTITFHITAPGEHYHVPLLLAPFAYSTYRGS